MSERVPHEVAELRSYYGPTDWNPDAGRLWHYDCPAGQGEVMYDKDGAAFCEGCGAWQAPETEAPESDEEPSAYQDLMTALVARRPDQSAAEDERIVLAALAKHARELAEQQRAYAKEVGLPLEDGDIVSAGDVIDLIDPNVGLVRPGEEPTT